MASPRLVCAAQNRPNLISYRASSRGSKLGAGIEGRSDLTAIPGPVGKRVAQMTHPQPVVTPIEQRAPAFNERPATASRSATRWARIARADARALRRSDRGPSSTMSAPAKVQAMNRLIEAPAVELKLPTAGTASARSPRKYCATSRPRPPT
jgi:hypothetical protein